MEEESYLNNSHFPYKIKSRQRKKLCTKSANYLRKRICSSNKSYFSDFNPQENIKYGTKKQAACGIITEYCDNSSIHGLRYIMGAQKRSLLERVFWTIFFLISTAICVNLISNVWSKWSSSPVIVSFDEKSTPIWEIPFPAVTVCPSSQLMEEVFNMTAVLENDNEDENTFTYMGNKSYFTYKEQIFMNILDQICTYNYFEVNNKTANGSEMINALIEGLSNETLGFCSFQGTYRNWSEILYKVVTDDGICYTFNNISPKDIYREETIVHEIMLETNYTLKKNWNLTRGYESLNFTHSYPQRVYGIGAKSGLELILNNVFQKSDVFCQAAVEGFKIVLHTPGEIPQTKNNFIRIPFKQDVLLSIRPKMIKTSDRLRSYDPTRRQCYFAEERYLKFFNVYTQNHCYLECLRNFTLKSCGCVKFSMPRTKADPVCGSSSLECMEKASLRLIQEDLGQDSKANEKYIPGVTHCGCLPSCNSITFEAEFSQAEFNSKAFFDQLERVNLMDDEDDDALGKNYTHVLIFFQELQFFTSKRSELYGFADFLANCGGLLGLSMGVSILSIVELIYFCTVRLFINLRRRLKSHSELECEQAKETKIV